MRYNYYSKRKKKGAIVMRLEHNADYYTLYVNLLKQKPMNFINAWRYKYDYIEGYTAKSL